MDTEPATKKKQGINPKINREGKTQGNLGNRLNLGEIKNNKDSKRITPQEVQEINTAN